MRMKKEPLCIVGGTQNDEEPVENSVQFPLKLINIL